MHRARPLPRWRLPGRGVSRDRGVSLCTWGLVAVLCLVPIRAARGGPEARLEAGDPEADEWIYYEEEVVWSFGFELDFLSQYAFRDVLSTEGPVLQPYAYFTYKSLTLDIYANMNLDGRDANRGHFDEVDFDCYLTAEIGESAYVKPHVSFSHFLQSEFEPEDDNYFIYGVAFGMYF